MKWFHKTLDTLHEKEILQNRHRLSGKTQSSFHTKLRLTGGILMLALAFLGVLLTNFAPGFAIRYWFYATPVFILINLVISWHAALGHGNYLMAWKELLHWMALLAGTFLVSVFLSMGVISGMIAGIFMLTILSITTFLAGIHFDSMLIIVGVILFLMAIVTAALLQFSLFIMIPIIVVAAVLIFWRLRDKSNSPPRRADFEDLDQEDR